MRQENTPPSFAEIRRLFKETDAKFKETNAQFKETDAQFKETRAQFKETDVRLARQSAETEQKLRRLEGLFGDQWGKLVEALGHPNALKLFRDRGLHVKSMPAIWRLTCCWKTAKRPWSSR